eukprot:TRINITY_DN7137_c0_g1_i2.p1 TRINITY_DN7137_c0_g1~~TRINITY_DN7137_c0_g1_i2.p1  ORF type:complete len:199 (+),score=25.14 TRINITY_DN7137_c0_g1_i2:54-650(+)
MNNILISIDTSKSEIAKAAIEAGANIINDITAGSDPNMLDIAIEYNVPIILMHSRGNAKTMTKLKDYPSGKIIETVAQELMKKVDEALRRGVYPWQIITDPGIGFAKGLKENLSVLKNLSSWRLLTKDFPYLSGPSRKGFIGILTDKKAGKDRVFGTTATVAASVQGGCSIIRVHDVKEMDQVLKVSNAIYRNTPEIM